MDTIVIGIDPGVVHTGCVALNISSAASRIDVAHAVIGGVNVDDVLDWVDAMCDTFKVSTDQRFVFIEDYNPGNFVRENKKMSEALGRLKGAMPASEEAPVVRYVDNAGVNTLIPPHVQKIFKVDSFTTPTHHNDLVSAGKIALLGMLKDKDYGLREMLSLIVRDYLNRNDWGVTHYV